MFFFHEQITIATEGIKLEFTHLLSPLIHVLRAQMSSNQEDIIQFDNLFYMPYNLTICLPIILLLENFPQFDISVLQLDYLSSNLRQNMAGH
jgi:hypothetical protein